MAGPLQPCTKKEIQSVNRLLTAGVKSKEIYTSILAKHGAVIYESQVYEWVLSSRMGYKLLKILYGLEM